MLKFGTPVPIVDSEVSNLMRIEPSHLTAKTTAVRNTSRPAPAAFERRADVDLTLSAVPDVRADVVARGKALVANPNYPSKAQIKSIARVLAQHWSK